MYVCKNKRMSICNGYVKRGDNLAVTLLPLFPFQIFKRAKKSESIYIYLYTYMSMHLIGAKLEASKYLII